MANRLVASIPNAVKLDLNLESRDRENERRAR
jgi:hypothetical protein